MITTTEKNKVLDLIDNHIQNDWSYMAVGTGTTAPVGSNSTLENEVLRKARQEISGTVSDRIVSLWINSVEANGNNLSEIGVFDAGSDGNMWMRQTFTPIAKDNNTEIWIDIEVKSEIDI